MFLGTGYQVLRTDSHMDEDITKSMTLPASSIQLRVSDETDLVGYVFSQIRLWLLPVHNIWRSFEVFDQVFHFVSFLTNKIFNLILPAEVSNLLLVNKKKSHPFFGWINISWPQNIILAQKNGLSIFWDLHLAGFGLEPAICVCLSINWSE